MQTIKLKRGASSRLSGRAASAEKGIAETLGSVYPRRVCISAA